MLSKIMSLTRLYSALRDTSALPDSSLIDAINDYYTEQLPYEVKLPELNQKFYLETVAGVGEYTLDPKVIDLWYPSLIENGQVYNELVQVRWAEESTAQDRPQAWLWRPPKVQLVPIPDDAYMIRFWGYLKPDPLLELTDQPVRSELNEIIALGAARLILNRLGDNDRADRTESQYQKLIAEVQQAASMRRHHFAATRSF